MKYIYNRNQYKNVNKINEILDSDKMDVEFGDTLIGGTLHRLLGFGRSMAQGVKMEQYAKQLDRFLAGIVAQPVIDEVKDEVAPGIEDEKEQEKETVKEISKPLMLDAAKKTILALEQGDTKKALELAPSKEQLIQVLGEEDANMVEQSLSVVEKEEESEEDLNQGDIIVYQDSKLQVVEIGDDVVKAKSEDGKEVEVPRSEIQKSEDNNESNDDVDKIKKSLQEYQSQYKELINFCNRCAPNDKFLKQLLKKLEAMLKSTPNPESWKDGKNSEIENYLGQAKERCEKCDTENNPVKESMKNNILSLLESYSILEKNEEKETAKKSILSEKEFDRIKKKLDEESKKIKVSKEQLLKMDDKIKNVSKGGIGELSGDNAKRLMSILTSAKDSLFHTKPYDEIRKKQKRYFDKVGSRAINRKGYTTWTKKVNELLSYYKDLLPKKVLTIITDSLDKTNMENDYVTLNKEFLGINKRKEGGDFKKQTEDGETHPVGTQDNELAFVGVDTLDISRKYKRSTFVMEVEIDGKGKGEFITGVVTESLKKANFFNFKYVKGPNVGWLVSYYNGKTFKTKPTTPSEDQSYNNNNDLEGVNFDNKLSGDVFYAQVNVGKSNIKKGDTLLVKSINFSDLFKDGKVEENDNGKLVLSKSKSSDIKKTESNWKVIRIGILVGNNDKKTAESKISTEIETATKGKDRYVDNTLFESIATYFAGNLGEDVKEEGDENNQEETNKFEELKRKGGDTVKYNSNSQGELEREVVEWKKDGVDIRTENGGTTYISKDKIIYDF